VEAFFESQRPEFVLLGAAKAGGISANNTYPAEFIYNNLAIQTHIINASWKTGVKRLLFLGSSCIYPRDSRQPLKEEYLLTGPLEATNEPYAIAKIAGIKMCQSYNRQYGTAFLAAMPTNLFGPNDNFDPETSHVLPALIRRFHEAKSRAAGDEQMRPVDIWGTGRPYREFLYVDDCADACVFLMNLKDSAFNDLLHSDPAPLINVGYGRDITISELALKIKHIVGFKGDIRFDTTRPDGTPKKCLDISRMKALGWTPKVSLTDGIKKTYEWCLNHSVF
jgi:GDP-L-fucose synthase